MSDSFLTDHEGQPNGPSSVESEYERSVRILEEWHAGLSDEKKAFIRRQGEAMLSDREKLAKADNSE